MTGRALAVSLFALASLAAASVRGESPSDAVEDEAPRRPNVLFISIDDLRPELGCYGVERMATPQLDRFAKGALRFTRAYCQQALCNPSRASYLTGTRPATTRVWNQQDLFRDTLPDVVTLPEHFKARGYRTVSMGKVFHGNRLDTRSWSEPEYLPDRDKVYAREDNVAMNRPRRKARATECEDVPDTAYRDGLLAEHAVAALKNMGDQPFFMALGFYKPHLPFAAPKRYWDRYPLESVRLPEHRSAPLGAIVFAMHDSQEVRQFSDAPPGPFPEEFMLRLLRGYLACTSYVDAQVGKVLAALEETGLDENTIVVIFGDHGFYLGDHGMWGKSGTFELAARVPLMVRVPGRTEPGSVSAGLVELVDLYPTLCELTGLERPGHLEGLSFAPLLAEPGRAWKRAAFTLSPLGPVEGASLCDERYRFTSWRTTDGKGKELARELYDHAHDPMEQVNLAAKPGAEKEIARMRELLDGGWRGALPTR